MADDIPEPTVGLLTFRAEGNEGGRCHSRVFHVPTESSGLTIGRGYDMKMRSKSEIRDDFLEAGQDTTVATLISQAAGMTGTHAEDFIAENHWRISYYPAKFRLPSSIWNMPARPPTRNGWRPRRMSRRPMARPIGTPWTGPSRRCWWIFVTGATTPLPAAASCRCMWPATIWPRSLAKSPTRTIGRTSRSAVSSCAWTVARRRYKCHAGPPSI